MSINLRLLGDRLAGRLRVRQRREGQVHSHVVVVAHEVLQLSAGRRLAEQQQVSAHGPHHEAVRVRLVRLVAQPERVEHVAALLAGQALDVGRAIQQRQQMDFEFFVSSLTIICDVF